jgi:hypothetical protein
MSLICGIFVIEIGFGSVLLQLNQIAGPIVCSEGDLDVMQHVDRFTPGETYYSISAYCVDSITGDKREVTNSVQLAAGLIYSIILFVIFTRLIIKYRDTIESKIAMSKGISGQVVRNERPSSVEKRLRKLKKLRESNSINEDDYQKKKDEILNNL